MAVEDPAAMRLGLETRFGPAVGQRLEDNQFFDAPDDRLRAADCGLRVRTETDLVTGRPLRSVLTYKGPRQPGELKRREEIETAVGDPEAAAAVLAALGYPLRLRFEKRRWSWRADGCEVELDEVPRLGWFLEIEGPDEAAIAAVRVKLGLENRPLEGRSYAALVRRELDRTGGGCELRFD